VSNTIQISRVLLNLTHPYLLLLAHSLEALFRDLVAYQQGWDAIFQSDTDVVKASRITELMAALATIYFPTRRLLFSHDCKCEKLRNSVSHV